MMDNEHNMTVEAKSYSLIVGNNIVSASQITGLPRESTEIMSFTVPEYSSLPLPCSV